MVQQIKLSFELLPKKSRNNYIRYQNNIENKQSHLAKSR